MGPSPVADLPSEVRPAATAEPKLVPPLRFGVVDSGIYRGCYPKPIFAEFLKHLELKTIISITPDALVDSDLLGLGNNVEFIHLEGAAQKSKSKKKRGVPINHELVARVLLILQNPAKRPVYVHCLNGRQTTSLIVGCLRLSQGWSIGSTFQEFARFCDYDRQDMLFVQQYFECQENCLSKLEIPDHPE